VIGLSLIGIVLYAMVEFVERNVVSWHVSQRDAPEKQQLLGS